MPKLWKVKRELQRVGQQLSGFIEKYTDPRKQHRANQAIENGLPQMDGSVSRSGKIAIFLLFQPSGLSPSIFETLNFLIANGYAPFVVSNAPISQTDRDKLSQFIWRGVERENFGYDFGGYRDGILCLNKWGIKPDELIILNDSVWLPTLPETDLFEKLSSHSADIAGTNLRVRGDVKFLESYLYRFNKYTLMHPKFIDFWHNIKLTSNKYYVIRRGERGFSQAMLEAGLTVEGLFDQTEFLIKIRQQNDDFLRKTLRFAAYTDSSLAQKRDKLLAYSDPDWREKALQHIEDVLKKWLAYSTFPYAMVQLFKYPLLKKSNDFVSKKWRAGYISAVESGDLPPPGHVLWHEIRQKDI